MGNGSIIRRMLEMKKRPEPLLLTHDDRVHDLFLFIFACPEVPLSCILQIQVFEDVSKDLFKIRLFFKIFWFFDRLLDHTAFGFPHIGGRGCRSRRVFKEILEALHKLHHSHFTTSRRDRMAICIRNNTPIFAFICGFNCCDNQVSSGGGGISASIDN
ncbi:hypothetical protein allotria_161 [Salmonella phage allotria]|uniref:Uncharacterized protein n=3 Tax=Kuttervirus TaxID=2169536 RepID=A0A6G8RM79_9CAUD|nr:hypothetical protein HYQ31_gp161 [Salmonella phage allotria]YP_009889099.1 hypothetical protein HYQ37_gp166 [Salmonella phage pertopsoe]YP_009889298.1 hypothetical protein HYQ38_gp163 [Salmonella phage maane]QIO02496.1 hypothetical protein allotria_161 [Salmonella phage allotria]QIO03371.1 hypothetical protein pertopsoe_166 [Salmonella phage pertopsoe]QIO03570.1 hypothetical protein maane_163 [Salmonella phage maane]